MTDEPFNDETTEAEARAAADEAAAKAVEAAEAAEDAAEAAEEAAEAAAAAKPKAKAKAKAKPAAEAAEAPVAQAKRSAADGERSETAEPAEEPAAKPKAKAKPKGKAKAAPKAAPAPTRRRRQPGDETVIVRAQARYVRSSARKARLVADGVRGKSVAEARAALAFHPRQVSEAWTKLLESAVANAENNHDLVGDDLKIHAIYADEGPTIKRYRPRAMGRATRIRKRTSHLTIQLTPKD